MIWPWVTTIIIVVLVGALIWLLWDKYQNDNQSISETWDDLKQDVKDGWDNLTGSDSDDTQGAAWQDGLDMEQSTPESAPTRQPRRRQNGGRQASDNPRAQRQASGRRGARTQRSGRDGYEKVDRALKGMNAELAQLPRDCMDGRQAGRLQEMLGQDKGYVRQLREDCRGQMPDWGCEDYQGDGGYCWQQTGNGQKECFLSGNNPDGSGGFWERADPSNCAGQPDCGDVMLSCQGFDPSAF